MLREKQKEGVLVVMTAKNIEIIQPDDQTLVIDEG